MAVTRHGPSIGTFRDKPIPSYIVTNDGCRHTFQCTTAALEDSDGGFELAKLAHDESVIAPGLIYRREQVWNENTVKSQKDGPEPIEEKPI